MANADSSSRLDTCTPVRAFTLATWMLLCSSYAVQASLRQSGMQTGRTLQQVSQSPFWPVGDPDKPLYCYHPNNFTSWTIGNCFQVAQGFTFGNTSNFYDFAWSHSTALTDLTFVNPGAASLTSFNSNNRVSAAAYIKPLPRDALGSNAAMGRQTAWGIDLDVLDADGITAGAAVDGQINTCFGLNGSSWWRVNLTTAQEVVFVQLYTDAPSPSVSVRVSNSTDITDTAIECDSLDLQAGYTGYWCNGLAQRRYGLVGQFVWVMADSYLSLCEATVYARNSNAALFKNVTSGLTVADSGSVPASIVDNDPATAYVLASASSSAYVTVDMTYSGRVAALSLYHSSSQPLRIDVRVGDNVGPNNTLDGSTNTGCTASDTIIANGSAFVIHCNGGFGRYVTLRILNSPVTAVIQEFGIYLADRPAADPVFAPPPLGTPSDPQSPSRPSPLPPAEAPEEGSAPSEAPAPVPNAAAPLPPSPLLVPAPAPAAASAGPLFVAPTLLALGEAVSTWNETSDRVLETELVALWNATGILLALSLLNWDTLGTAAPAPAGRRRLQQVTDMGRRMQYEASSLPGNVNALVNTITNTLNNEDVTTAVRTAGLEVNVSLDAPVGQPYSQSQVTGGVGLSPQFPGVVVVPTSSGSSLSSGVIVGIVAGCVALLVVAGILTALLLRRKRRRSKAMQRLSDTSRPDNLTAMLGNVPTGAHADLWVEDDSGAGKKRAQQGLNSGITFPTRIQASQAHRAATDSPAYVDGRRHRGLLLDSGLGETTGSGINSPLSMAETSDAESSWRAIATPVSSRAGGPPIERLWQVAYADLKMEKQIGEGSFGKVFLARWRETIVAVKVLSNPDVGTFGTPPHTEEDALVRAEALGSMMESLEKEAAMMATLRHPNVVMYLGICLDPPCVVTEYCARGSLSDVLKRGRLSKRGGQQIDWAKLLSMALDAAKGMFFLHSNEPPIIHRDLKSPNLLVDKHWKVKVCDFNLSRFMEEQCVLSSLAATNPRWLAPEILSGQGYTFSSDVYSFGIILWELMTWQVPWQECGPWQVVAQVTEGQLRPTIPADDQIPCGTFSGLREYISLMQDCWAQEPSQRPAFGAVITRLRQLLRNESLSGKAGVSGELRPGNSDASSQYNLKPDGSDVDSQIKRLPRTLSPLSGDISQSPPASGAQSLHSNAQDSSRINSGREAGPRVQGKDPLSAGAGSTPQSRASPGQASQEMQGYDAEVPGLSVAHDASASRGSAVEVLPSDRSQLEMQQRGSSAAAKGLDVGMSSRKPLMENQEEGEEVVGGDMQLKESGESKRKGLVQSLGKSVKGLSARMSS